MMIRGAPLLFVLLALALYRIPDGKRVIGATDKGQFAVPFDPQKLAAGKDAGNKDAGDRVRPEHIQDALRQYAGIADHPYSCQFPLGVKAEEQLQNLWR